MVVLYFLLCLGILPYVGGAPVDANRIQNILERLEYVENRVKHLETENKILKTENKQIWKLLLASTISPDATHNYNSSEPKLQNGRNHIESNDRTDSNQKEPVRSNTNAKNKRLLAGTMTPTDTRVAFKAGTSKYINHLGGHQIIEFDKVLLNDGNAYSPLHGHMIAPVRGVYLLSCTIYTDPQTQLAFEIVLNGQRIDTMYAIAKGLSDGMSQSKAFPILLEKGDMVWLRTHPGFEGSNVYGSPSYYHNSFSGVLLYEKSN